MERLRRLRDPSKGSVACDACSSGSRRFCSMRCMQGFGFGEGGEDGVIGWVRQDFLRGNAVLLGRQVVRLRLSDQQTYIPMLARNSREGTTRARTWIALRRIARKTTKGATHASSTGGVVKNRRNASSKRGVNDKVVF